jgi:hypothetical protein
MDPTPGRNGQKLDGGYHSCPQNQLTVEHIWIKREEDCQSRNRGDDHRELKRE